MTVCKSMPDPVTSHHFRPVFSLGERRLREAADIKRGWASRNAVIDDVESLLRYRCAWCPRLA
jgi:hypothetical protein